MPHVDATRLSVGGEVAAIFCDTFDGDQAKMTDRLPKILTMLEKTPADAFLLYAAGIEYRKARDFPQAVAMFDRTIAADPKYCYAFYQKGQTLEDAGDSQQAAEAYRAGIAAARAAGDGKALGELQQALDIIE